MESRPQHLISRLKSRTQLPGPRVKIIRQPKAPDGTKGFQLEHNIVSLQSELFIYIRHEKYLEYSRFPEFLPAMGYSCESSISV